jgi:Sec63 Brl domain
LIPRLKIDIRTSPITRGCLQINLSITKADFIWEDSFHGDSEPFWIFVTDCDGEALLYHEYFTVKKKFMARKAHNSLG